LILYIHQEIIICPNVNTMIHIKRVITMLSCEIKTTNKQMETDALSNLPSLLSINYKTDTQD